MQAIDLLTEATEYAIDKKEYRTDFPIDHPMYPFVHRLSGNSTGDVGKYIVDKLGVYGKTTVRTTTQSWFNQIKLETPFDTLVLVYIEPNRLTVIAIPKTDLIASGLLFNNNHKSLREPVDKVAKIPGAQIIYQSNY